MGYKINDGAYAVDENGKLIFIDYMEELLQNATLMIRAKREKFYPDKNYGSHITASTDSLPMILAYARQALSELDGVCVKSASVVDDSISFTLLINGEERSVIVSSD